MTQADEYTMLQQNTQTRRIDRKTQDRPFALTKPIYLLYAFCLIGAGLLLWCTPFPGGIFLIRWGIMFACKASPKLRSFIIRHLHKTRFGSLVLPV